MLTSYLFSGDLSGFSSMECELWVNSTDRGWEWQPGSERMFSIALLIYERTF